MESNHNLNITGNLFVEGGGVPVVSTIGVFQVNVNYTVPVQAQGISTSGGSSASEIAIAVRALLLPDFTELKGAGYDVSNHSLVKIKQQASLAAALSA
jgi:hypothetical protein